MKLTSLDQIKKQRPPNPERVAAITRALELDGKLHALREARGVTQAALAEKLQTSRPNVSRIESESDVRLSTLERYVTALGGSVRVEAIFDGEAVTLLGEPAP